MKNLCSYIKNHINIQKTQNALNIMVTTGQTPMRPTDNRTQTERYADLEKIKINLVLQIN